MVAGRVMGAALLISSALCTGLRAEVTVMLGPDEPRLDAQGNVVPGKLNNPFGIDFDAAGAAYIVEFEGGRILSWDTVRGLKVLAGGRGHAYAGDGGDPAAARFHDMHNVAATAEGVLYISDHLNHCIRLYDPGTRQVSTFAGNGQPGFAGDGKSLDQARFNLVMNVTLSPDQKRLLVADLGNRRIRSIDLLSGRVSTVAGDGRRGVPRDGALAVASPLVDPRAAAEDREGKLYVLERGGHALRVVHPDGRIYTVAGTGKKGFSNGPALEAAMNGPKHIAIDAAGNVYIADDLNHAIRKFDPQAGTLTTLLGRGPVKLRRPHGVCVQQDRLYVVDSWQHRILLLDL